jgi:TrmH family RNA methyltransferase
VTLSLDQIKKLHQKKYRQQLGYFLVEGEHLVLELHKAIIGNPALAQSQLLVTQAYADWPSPLPKKIINEKQMAQIADTKTPQGVMAVAPLPEKKANPNQPAAKTIYLHEIQDPGNLGTILRSLAWFGGFDCLLSPGCVDPYNPKVVRASMGAIFHVSLQQDVELHELTQKYARLACLDMQGARPSSASFKDCDCYVFGNEARGLPAEVKNFSGAERYSIPGSGTIESLNLATAVNICLYELVREKP